MATTSNASITPTLEKYWARRYAIFSRFDSGIRMDAQCWYSVTPETVAIKTAQRMRPDMCVVDAFCGAGGNAIQFAKTCRKVVAIDIDPEKIAIARHNAAIYGVADRIQFIVGDFLAMADSGNLRADAVFLGPPWGGPEYTRNKGGYDIQRDLLPVPATVLVAKALLVSTNVAFYLPRSSDVSHVERLGCAWPAGRQRVEIERNVADDNWWTGITAYFGDLIDRSINDDDNNDHDRCLQPLPLPSKTSNIGFVENWRRRCPPSPPAGKVVCGGIVNWRSSATMHA